jgi:prephenate dehydrogenase
MSNNCELQAIHIISYQLVNQLSLSTKSVDQLAFDRYESPIFEEFSKLMSLDLGVQIGGQDMELLFDSLSELETFRNKKSCVKSGR